MIVLHAAAPAHQLAEVLLAVSRLQRSGVLDRRQVQDVMDRAVAVEQDPVRPTPAHVRRAVVLSDHMRVTDGLYVALAGELGYALVTTDRRLGRAGLDCEVRTPPDL